MHISQFLRLAKALRNEGDSVIEQFEDVLINGESMDEQNPNALQALLPILDKCDKAGVEGAADFATEIRDYLKEHA